MTVRQVAHVTDTFGALSETFVYTCVTHHRDYRPSVVCRARENASAFPFEDVTTIPEIWTRVHPVRLASEMLRAATGRSLWQRRVGRWLAGRQPAVVHAHFGQVGVRILPAVRRAGVPMVITFYGQDAFAYSQSVAGRAALPELFAQGALFVAEGPHLRDQLIRLGAPSERTRLLPIPLEPDRYPPWQPSGAQDVLFAGRFVEKKGLSDAIRAFSKARRTLPALRMRIIGDGPERENALRTATAEGVGDAMSWLGYQPHQMLITELRSCAALLQPSMTARDGDSEGGAPTTLLEAQAMGVPIVATRHADIPYVAPEGPGIRLAAERDTDALARALVEVVTARRGSDSRRVVERHDANAVSRTREALYREVLSERREAVSA